MTGIMIVEDRGQISEAIKATLTLHGYDVVAWASNGKEAIEKFKKTLPDLILMDLLLPDMNGLDVTKIILEIEPDTKVVAMTAMVQEGVLEDVLRIGCSKLLVKPFRMKELVEVVNEVMET